ncbi:MAG: hypothetical protein ACP59X_05460 [Solidesulfovibrio sp. DCME]|uniref:hypothetical protein n=1 Tax=Solidesulfovibrio sp. DCME TaxID=3447380 RepID=UPI003D11C6D2
MKRLACMLCGLFLSWALAATAAEPARDPSRDVFLQTIGMLAGQGLVLGHEALEGLYARYEKRLVSRENAERALADQARYADWVLAAFKDRLMGRLAEQEKKDLALLIGFYEVQRQAVEALAVYVRMGGAKNRENVEAQLERLAAIIRQISLGGGPS